MHATPTHMCIYINEDSAFVQFLYMNNEHVISDARAYAG